MLVLDRFLSAGGSALDLATGAPIRVRMHARPASTPLYARKGGWRLIDAGPRGPRGFVEAWARAHEVPTSAGVSIEAVRAALHDARDGCPRAVDLATVDAAQWRRTTLDMAREARLAGFVPVSIGVLGEILRGSRWRWPRWLADRSLLVITCDGQVCAAGAIALLRLASRDARPHLLVRGSTSDLTASARLVLAPPLVHEGGNDAWPEAEPLSPQALAEQAWQRTEDGRTDESTASAARWALMLGGGADAEATARAALAVTLATQGRLLEARASVPDETAGGLSPAVERRVAGARQQVTELELPQRGERALTDDFIRVLEACQAIEDEQTIVGRVLALLRDRLSASGVACVLVERDRVQVLAQVGTLPPDLAVPRLVATSGAVHRPGEVRTPAEAAWPVRYAGTVIGAIWGRWSAGLPVRVADADGLMTLAAAAIAPAAQATADRARAQAEPTDIPELVGQSEPMGQLRAAVVRAARSPFPVLIEGESGSGKELVARAIHRTSSRRDRRFSTLNCAALSDELAEAELFGHAKGAFTGAVTERAGLFEACSGGTLFLDEVSELSLRIQAKLLRVLQEQEVRRLGESHVRAIDTRIVAASNRPLAEEVLGGRFRRDLRYRLDVVRLAIPPLRERLEDVPALVRHIWGGLLEKTGSRAILSPAALAALGRYDWPGNVRELQNVLASLIVTSPARGVVSVSQLPMHMGRPVVVGEAQSLAAARREFELRFVKAALARVEGRPAAAARELGVSRQGLAKVLSRLGLRAVPPGAPADAEQARAG